MPHHSYIINTRQEKEPFSFKKIYRSAKRVGVSRDIARKIASEIEREIYSGAKTKDISKEVKRILFSYSPSAALKFSIKDAMRKLGPTGFPFEKYIGEIFSRNGYNVSLNRHIAGFCNKARYEIDFLAEKGKKLKIGECKYRNAFGERIHLEIALSNYARFLDIKNSQSFKEKESNGFEIKSILVTNTKFTTNVTKYSRCVGVELLGWNWPKNRGLEYLIDSQRLYPITILPSFKRCFADIFSQRRIMIAKDILDIDIVKFSKSTNLPLSYLNTLLKEAKLLEE
ncbi:hypothetical protein J7J23_00335 [bacterium]|nr:hypothetical protein [bacterium]